MRWSDLCGLTQHLVSETSLLTEPRVSACQYCLTGMLSPWGIMGGVLDSSACVLPKAVALFRWIKPPLDAVEGVSVLCKAGPVA